MSANTLANKLLGRLTCMCFKPLCSVPHSSFSFLHSLLTNQFCTYTK